MEIDAIRKIEFDAGHRVANHESKCATLHGHRYVLELYARGKALDDIGRVIDFSVLKEIIGTWIDEYWDHTTLVWKKDVETLELLKKMPQFKPPYECDFNPTAENMAAHLIQITCPHLLEFHDVEVVKIRLWETPNCYVEVTK